MEAHLEVLITPFAKHLKKIKDNLSSLQAYPCVDVCILGTGDTNFNFFGIFQGHFENHV